VDEVIDDVIDVLFTKRANVVLGGSLALALLITVVSGVWTRFFSEPKVEFNLLGRMGDVKWDFTKSWASNVTVVGAVIATVLTNAARALPTSGLALELGFYQGLSLFTAALIFAGAFIYNAIRPAESVVDEKGNEAVEYRGFILLFFVATILTLWAVWGQLWVLYLMADDMADTSLTGAGSAAFQVLALVAAIFTLIYACLSIPDTLRYHAATGQNSVWKANSSFVKAEAERLTGQTGTGEAAIGSWALL
jgi:hypothetical protein